MLHMVGMATKEEKAIIKAVRACSIHGRAQLVVCTNCHLVGCFGCGVSRDCPRHGQK